MTFQEQAQLAYQQVDRVYNEAIIAREAVDALMRLVPNGDGDTYAAIRDGAYTSCVDTINAVWKARLQLETLVNSADQKGQKHDKRF